MNTKIVWRLVEKIKVPIEVSSFQKKIKVPIDVLWWQTINKLKGFNHILNDLD